MKSSDRHRLLAPVRAVVVEDGDPLGGLDVFRARLVRDALDEFDDRLPARARVPALQSIAHRSPSSSPLRLYQGRP
jgi:hypothetical protein